MILPYIEMVKILGFQIFFINACDELEQVLLCFK